jgi:hypothetical protein
VSMLPRAPSSGARKTQIISRSTATANPGRQSPGPAAIYRKPPRTAPGYRPAIRKATWRPLPPSIAVRWKPSGVTSTAGR